MNTNELLQMKSRLDKMKIQSIKLQGQLDHLYSLLKSSNCSGIEQAKELAEKKQSEIDFLIERYEKDVSAFRKELREIYEKN